jgi:predicted nucleic acid-binding protein
VAAVVLLDTGSLVALMNRRERDHDWARSAFARVPLPLLTCQAVLTEAFFLLAKQPGPLATLQRHIEAGRFVDAMEFDTLAPRIMALMGRYASVPMSFADACLVAMAEERPGAPIFTLDRDFLVYRRVDGQPLALLAPFVE